MRFNKLTASLLVSISLLSILAVLSIDILPVKASSSYWTDYFIDEFNDLDNVYFNDTYSDYIYISDGHLIVEKEAGGVKIRGLQSVLNCWIEFDLNVIAEPATTTSWWIRLRMGGAMGSLWDYDDESGVIILISEQGAGWDAVRYTICYNGSFQYNVHNVILKSTTPDNLDILWLGRQQNCSVEWNEALLENRTQMYNLVPSVYDPAVVPFPDLVSPAEIEIAHSASSGWSRINISRIHQYSTASADKILPGGGKIFGLGFDAPYDSVLSNALPILEANNATASIMVDQKYADQGEIGEGLTWEQDKILIETYGWEPGIHYSEHLIPKMDYPTFMDQEFNWVAANLTHTPVSMCALANSENWTHASYGYDTLGMISRQYHVPAALKEYGIPSTAGTELSEYNYYGNLQYKDSFQQAISSNLRAFFGFTHKVIENPGIHDIELQWFSDFISNLTDAGYRTIPVNEGYWTLASAGPVTTTLTDNATHLIFYVNVTEGHNPYFCVAYKSWGGGAAVIDDLGNIIENEEISSTSVGFWINETRTYTVTPSISFDDFEITNFSSGNWLFSQEKYYNFKLTATTVIGHNLQTIELNFTDGAERPILLYYRNDTDVGGLIEGEDYVNVPPQEVQGTTINRQITVIWKVMLRNSILDKLDVDFESWANTTLGDVTSWTAIKSNYANIYSRGGIAYDSFGTYSGRYDGGDIFGLYSYNGTGALAYTYFRNLQHIKLLCTLQFDPNNRIVGGGQTDVISYLFGIEYYIADSWVNYFEAYFTLQEYSGTGDYIYAEWQVEMYARMSEGAYQTIGTQNIWAYYEPEIRGSAFWIDLWFNRINASSTIGMRVTAYYYAMKNDAWYWTRWLYGNNWGPMYGNSTNLVVFDSLIPRYANGSAAGRRYFAKEVELMRIFGGPASSEDDVNATIIDINVFDLTITTGNMEGIPTPTFEDSKAPVMPQGGFLGWLGSALAGFWASLMGSLTSLYGFLSNAVLTLTIAFIHATLGYLDGLLFLLFHQENMATNMVSGISNFFIFFGSVLLASISSFVTFMADSFTLIIAILTGIAAPLAGFFQNAASVIGTVTSSISVMFEFFSGTGRWAEGGSAWLDYGPQFRTGVMGLMGVMMVAFPFFLFIECAKSMSLAPAMAVINGLWLIARIFIKIAEWIWRILMAVVGLVQWILSLGRGAATAGM